MTAPKRQPPPPPSSALVPLRGPSGRLYGMLDPATATIEFSRGGRVERVKLPAPPKPPES